LQSASTSDSSLLCLCCPSRPAALIALSLEPLSRLSAVFSETSAALCHSLAMTSTPIAPAGHYGIEPPLVSSARSRLAHWRSTRQPQSAWQSSSAMGSQRDSQHLRVCASSAAPQHASNSARLLSRMLHTGTCIWLYQAWSAFSTSVGESLLWPRHGPRVKQTAKLIP
jgi:hypothetical protein